jgi:pimeloyl-ACP methyl ester carboxylesterase
MFRFALKMLCVLLLSFQAYAQDTIALPPPISGIGNWVGELNVGAPLQVIFKVIGPVNLRGSLDVPAQGAKDIPFTIMITRTRVKFGIEALQAVFEGDIVDSTHLRGVWKQGAAVLPLQLVKTDSVKSTLKRPQTPQPPFPYDEQDFTVEYNGISLDGTLTLPKGKGPFPAVILITGSGQQDRDETIFGHKPFWVLADHLTKSGIAVLRLDDRGVGRSLGDISHATSADFADDIEHALDSLLRHKSINPKKVGLCGHSEGGMIAQIIAARSPQKVAFFCSLAGPGISGAEVLIQQTAAIASKSLTVSEAAEAIQSQKKVIKTVLSLRGDPNAAMKLTDSMELWAKQQNKFFSRNTNEVKAQIQQLTSPWYMYFLDFDPANWLPRVKCPVLAINGGLDMQVDASANLAGIEKALKKGGNKQVTIRNFPSMNHLFQKCSTGAIQEYMAIEWTIETEVLDYISAWINDIVQRKR